MTLFCLVHKLYLVHLNDVSIFDWPFPRLKGAFYSVLAWFRIISYDSPMSLDKSNHMEIISELVPIFVVHNDSCVLDIWCCFCVLFCVFFLFWKNGQSMYDQLMHLSGTYIHEYLPKWQTFLPKLEILIADCLNIRSNFDKENNKTFCNTISSWNKTHCADYWNNSFLLNHVVGFFVVLFFFKAHSICLVI